MLDFDTDWSHPRKRGLQNLISGKNPVYGTVNGARCSDLVTSCKKQRPLVKNVLQDVWERDTKVPPRG
jgi:hypothetical protein